VWPGGGIQARDRMSVLACLAHELAHADRHRRGFNRAVQKPDMLLDEAEASLHASFYPSLGRMDRCDLVEDARDQLIAWLSVSISGTTG
jgi:hypothetical protein